MATYKDIDTALRVYHTYPELDNKNICELFGCKLAKSTLSRYKKEIKQRQLQDDVKTTTPYVINTKTAFEVWGIDVADLERRRKKLKELNL